jgi:hypothetical protein
MEYVADMTRFSIITSGSDKQVQLEHSNAGTSICHICVREGKTPEPTGEAPENESRFQDRTRSQAAASAQIDK